jgi:hypothetical protein
LEEVEAFFAGLNPIKTSFNSIKSPSNPIQSTIKYFLIPFNPFQLKLSLFKPFRSFKLLEQIF